MFIIIRFFTCDKTSCVNIFPHVVFKASGATAIRALFNLLNKENKPVILLGPSNTAALEPVAESARLWSLVQVWTSTLLLSC